MFKNKQSSGGKKDKEHIKIILVANISGIKNLKLFNFGKDSEIQFYKEMQYLPLD